ncbi:MAG: AMP-binding protein, partial [bacterium]
MNLINLQKENLEKFGEYTSLAYEDKEYTNLQIHTLGNQLANGLKNLGLTEGDKVIVCVPNCPEVLVSYSGISKAGMIIIPVLFLLQTEEIRYILNKSAAKAIITSWELIDKIKAAASGASSLKHIIVIGKEIEGKVSFEKLIAESGKDFAVQDVADDDLAVILYTSGTTGKPKGVMLSHDNLMSNVRASTKSLTTVTKYTVSLVVLPLAHAYGLTVLLGGFALGGKGVIMRWFDTEKVLETIQKYRVEIMAGVPTMYIYMLNHRGVEKYDLSSMRIWLSAAAPLPIETYRAFEARFPGKIYEGYGLTEAAPAVSLHYDTRPIKPGSVGIPVDNIEVKIYDDENKTLPVGEIGEICIKGPIVMKGYYEMPEETADTIIDGWLHTGDMGRLDEDGYLYVVER